MKRALAFAAGAILLGASALSVSCAGASQTHFGIFLASTGELILSDAHIAAYDSAGHFLELNAAGIKRWNSYRTYRGTGVPMLNERLYHKEFVIKADDTEICRGTFNSAYSSMLFQRVTIDDMVGSPDSEFNRLWVQCSYVDGYQGLRYDNVFADLESAFASLGLLK